MSFLVKPFLAALVALALVAGCQSEPASETGATEETPAVDPAAVRHAIEDGRAAWTEAALAGDAASLAALYAEDAIVQAPNAPRMVGRAAIQAGYAEWFATAPFRDLTITTEGVDVSESGDLAWAYGDYTSTISLADGTTIEDSGKWLSIHENRDGTWVYAALTWNSDLAVPGMEGPASP